MGGNGGNDAFTDIPLLMETLDDAESAPGGDPLDHSKLWGLAVTAEVLIDAVAGDDETVSGGLIPPLCGIDMAALAGSVGCWAETVAAVTPRVGVASTMDGPEGVSALLGFFINPQRLRTVCFSSSTEVAADVTRVSDLVLSVLD